MSTPDFEPSVGLPVSHLPEPHERAGDDERLQYALAASAHDDLEAARDDRSHVAIARLLTLYGEYAAAYLSLRAARLAREKQEGGAEGHIAKIAAMIDALPAQDRAAIRVRLAA